MVSRKVFWGARRPFITGMVTPGVQQACGWAEGHTTISGAGGRCRRQVQAAETTGACRRRAHLQRGGSREAAALVVAAAHPECV